MKGQTKHYLYQTWHNMFARCLIPGVHNYKNYGGRGIKVCGRWLLSFDSFVEDMGPRPKGYSIDRIDNDGDYEPSNCRWADKKDQARNTQRARWIQFQGKLTHVAEIAQKYGLEQKTVAYRASIGKSDDEIISKTPMWRNSESQKKAVAVHAALMRSMTHCKRGHEFTEANIYWYKGGRACKRCRSDCNKAIYAREKLARLN